MHKHPDVDIDFRTDFDPLAIFPTAIRASQVEKETIKKHNVGIYLQDIPLDPVSGLSAVPYKAADDLGYFKIDFLHLTLLDVFESKYEIRALTKIEPDWSLLEDRETVEKLFQVHRHYDLLYRIKPKSIQELADVIALIRPGKKMLLNAYLKNKTEVRMQLYKKPDDPDKYYFKRSHSLAYAMNIVLQLHLIKAKVL